MKAALLIAGHAIAFAGGALIPQVPAAGVGLIVAAFPIIHLGYKQ